MTANAWIYILGGIGLLGIPTVLIFALLYQLAPGVEPVKVGTVQLGPPASATLTIPVSDPPTESHRSVA